MRPMLKTAKKLSSVSNRGEGIIGVLIAAAILIILAVGGLSFFTKPRVTLSKLATATDCNTVVAGLVSHVKSFDNTLLVRSWLPTAAKPYLPSHVTIAGATSDPLCKPGPYAACDTVKFLEYSGSHINYSNIHMAQNVRGASTWAQSVFNTHKPTICSTGLTLTKAQLESILPGTLVLPDWIQNAKLTITEVGSSPTPCSGAALSTIGLNSTNSFDVKFEISGTPTGAQAPQVCDGKTSLSFPTDRTPPQTTLSITNGASDPIAIINAPTPAACTCKKTVDQVLLAGGCPEAQTVNIQLSSSEPGSLLLCQKNGPSSEAFAGGTYVSCGDLTFTGATKSFSPDITTTIKLNETLQTTWSFNNLTVAGDDAYELLIRNLDVGGNSTDTNLRFRVKTPSCPNRNTYCPNSTPVGAGIFFWPSDDCNNGLCPSGTHSICDAADAPNHCGMYADDCGNMVCAGTRPQNCAPANTIPCGNPIPDLNGCGSCPGTGTQGCVGCTPTTACEPSANFCGTPSASGFPDSDGCNPCPAGTDPGCAPCVPDGSCVNPTTFCGPPTPDRDNCGNPCPVGTNCPACTCPALDTIPAGTFVADSCGNANACGPGCLSDGAQCAVFNWKCGWWAGSSPPAFNNCSQCCSGNSTYECLGDPGSPCGSCLGFGEKHCAP